MEQKIAEIIRQTTAARNAEETEGIERWRTPLVSFASADDPLMTELKNWVDPKHLLPGDMLKGAQSVICYYLPFNPEIPKSNRGERLASREWVDTYVETNKLIDVINEKLKNYLAAEGYACETTPATHNFDPKVLISYWSHRHLAYIAGLGTFGLNNMLITDEGTAGRFGSCVTNLKLTPGKRPDGENCLYKAKGTCGVCAKKCVNGALTTDGFDRFKCYDMCLENDAANNIGTLADVCGKCIAGMPCSNRNPMK
ncbi:MAG TPA: (Fe-S)-binding protein [Spirochaeta sp.]|nr:(Fe-S)-binding protein [Spirochaeta sp.]